jgi:hypothetical protein
LIWFAASLLLVTPVRAQFNPNQGPGGPILILAPSGPSFGKYFAEILRTEGFNSFSVADITSLTTTLLAGYDAVVLPEVALTSTQATTLANWVNGGGKLIVMKPDVQLAGVLGIAPTGGSIQNGYMQVDKSTRIGNGIAGQTLQFHGSANLYSVAGATALATLYVDATNSSGSPAVTLRSVGSNGGQSAMFAYDLARSIVYTRQGNPAWAGQERDGMLPPIIRSDDLFYGNSATDPQPDWVDRRNVAIPQADEQQRFFANLLTSMMSDRRPLPRFWYLPNGKKAAIVMTGDDHGNNGTQPRFNQFMAASPVGCSVANWECVRGTSYIYPGTPLANSAAAAFEADGFEVGLHINTGCADFTPASLESFYSQQITDFTSTFPGVSGLFTQRHHCITWSDWVTAPRVQLAHGMRLDTSYYYWPPDWVANTPGHFTGSAMPMRFADLDGSIIDVYQAVTQMTDESGQSYPFTVDTLLDRALGPEEHYGVYTINAHTDAASSAEADAVVTSAKARGVPVVSSRQMLNWLDGRNGSTFAGVGWNGSSLAFTIVPGAGAVGLQAMVPRQTPGRVLASLSRNGNPHSFSIRTIKGVEYALFAAAAGSYSAEYLTDTTAPTVVSTTPANGATNIALASPLKVVFSEPVDPATVSSATFELRDAANAVVPASITYVAAAQAASVVPVAQLAGGAAYTLTVRGGATDPRVKDLAGNPLGTTLSVSFTTSTGPTCPCSIWDSSSTPTNPSIADSSVELGVKFRSDVDGYITGIRFYKGSGNTGVHTGSLWSSSGQLLASATFTGETATGWQQVSFFSPVAVTANTVYVASYHAPNGGYAANGSYFSSAGANNGVLHALQDGVSGGNGVYAYSATSTFPSSTYQATNYWVDVVLATSVGPDLTPPTVTGQIPAPGATGVATTAAVTATFSEALDNSTIDATTFELRSAGNALVAATVAYDAASKTATITPSAALANSTIYTATVKGGTTDPRVKDQAGNALASNVSWSFTTAAAGAPACTTTTSIWPANPTPSIISDSDTSAVELGVKFRSTVNGFVCGIRFYKGPGNTGTHTGTLWNNAGQQLATANFTGETASGWQQVGFSSPVAINANTVYVASYRAPVGRYSANGNYFTSGITSGPLYALSSAESGGNGVYLYGAGGFPTNTFQSSNYWVDVVFTTSTDPDTTPPTVLTTAPGSGAAGVNPATSVTATFSEAMGPSTINASTFDLRGPANTLVLATVSYSGNTATLTPNSPLATNTIYLANVKGGANGVKDLAGNPLAADQQWQFTTGVDPCSTGGNPIVCENGKPGNPPSEWDIGGAGDPSIQGFATDISVNRGGTISFKVDTNATNYRFDIYRMGYYGGMGARKVATLTPSATLPQSQPSCLNDAATGLIDCGNWAVSGSWTVPASATSGIYFAKLVRPDTGGASHVVFVVRDDASTSDLLFQTSDTTWQAYNNFGGSSLYTGSPAGRAYKVSYNRPFNTRAVDGGQDWVFNAEYPMVRWLESNGYNVSYSTGVDSDRFGNLIRNHKTFLSVGHDEYWSGGQRANVEAARNAGVHLAFLSGNEVFWKTRWENSIGGPATAYRTLVCYKETHAGAKIDPAPNTWTGTWRDPRFSPPADAGLPENALTGTIFVVNDSPGATTSIVVPAEDGKMRFWRNTSIASLAQGSAATLPFATLGYEWDIDADNGFRPAGLFRLSTTSVNNVSVLQDYGSNYANGSATHSLTLYKHTSGALVFGAGTVQWPWGLDSNHDRGNAPADPRMQQAMINLLADMGNQPATLQPGLVAAAASSDTLLPSSAITSPVNGAVLAPGAEVTVAGTAADTGGGVVGGVEVSVDGGTTWHPAIGRANWTYSWTPSVVGSVTIKSRAVDDSGNLEALGTGVTVIVGTSDTTPPTVTVVSPANAATGMAANSTVAVTFSESMNPATISTSTLELRNASTNALIAASVSYNDSTRVATLTPSATLANATAFNVTVRGGATDPRVKDLAGNALGANYTSSFTTIGDTSPPPVPGTPAAVATGSGVSVTWAAVTAVDLAGYRLYRASVSTGPYALVNAGLLPTAAFDDTLAPSGTSYYRVTSVDTSGNESQQSGTASAVMSKANLVVNAGFELDANGDSRPDSWTTNTNVVRSNVLARSGSFSMRHSSSANAGYSISQPITGLAGGTAYTFAGWANIPSTTDSFTVSIRVAWRSALNVVLRTDSVKSYSASTVGWNKALASLVSPTGTTNAQVQIVVSSLNATVYVDDFSLR